MRMRSGLALSITCCAILTANIAVAAPFVATDMKVFSDAASTEQVAHRRGATKRGTETSAPSANAYDTYTGFGSGGRMNADDDFAFGGYDPDYVVDYRNGWNSPGMYVDGIGPGAGYGMGGGMGMWGW
jgi:hypothetical protein